MVAYYFGLKFVETALLEIPQHGYFYSDKFSRLRLESTVNALQVCHSLQEIIAKEPQQLVTECRKIELLHGLAMEQFENLSNYEIARKRAVYELNKAYPKLENNGYSNGGISSSGFTSTLLLACGDTFTSVFCPNAQTSTVNDEYRSSFPDEVSELTEEAKRQHLYPSMSSTGSVLDPPMTTLKSSSRTSSRQSVIKSTASLLDTDEEDEAAPYRSLDPPGEKPLSLLRDVAVGVGLDASSSSVLPPEKLTRMSSDYDLRRVLFLSGLDVQFNDAEQASTSSATTPVAPPGAKKRESTGVSITILATFFHEDFDTLRSRGRVLTRQLPTYQGRLPGSINGCTIIAPLLCIHHFLYESSIPDPGLPDQAIVQVIDEETPNILPLVRQSLGLVKDAFLIPADAHDSLISQQYMCHEQFLTVCGGNILEDNHLQGFLDQISKVGPKKLAASFFFHEHVITILQLRRSQDSAWFDVIDSLPHKETFLSMDETSTTGSSSGTGSIHSNDATTSPNHQDWRWTESGELMGSAAGYFGQTMDADEPPVHATRIRCRDVESLKATLLWYACSVFSRENRTYIDSYEWDEKLSDFDPRVFQAFIWTEA